MESSLVVVYDRLVIVREWQDYGLCEPLVPCNRNFHISWEGVLVLPLRCQLAVYDVESDEEPVGDYKRMLVAQHKLP